MPQEQGKPFIDADKLGETGMESPEVHFLWNLLECLASEGGEAGMLTWLLQRHSSVCFLGCGEAFWSRTVGRVQLGKGLGFILQGPLNYPLPGEVRSPLCQQALLVALSTLPRIFSKLLRKQMRTHFTDTHSGLCPSSQCLETLLLFLLRLVLSGNSQGKSTAGK